MLEPLDRCRRYSTLFQFTNRQLRDYIDPNPLLIRIDEELDFTRLVAPLQERCCPDFGWPAIHPESVMRSLLVCSIYNIASFQRLCSAISENLPYRWFGFLTIYHPVFNHSAVSHFLNRIGWQVFPEVFDSLHSELLRIGLPSPDLCGDSSIVKANVNSYGLSRSGLTVEEFRKLTIETKGLFILSGKATDEAGVGQDEVRFYQDPQARLPQSPVDKGAHWRSSRPG